MKRKTNVEKEPKKDIVFAPTEEIQNLGFSNIFLAYDESNEGWSLHLRYSHVICDNNNDNSPSATITTTIKEDGEQKQDELCEQQQPTPSAPPSYEERRQIVVDGCDPDRYMPTNHAIRAEFERQQIDKLTMEKFIDHFWDMNLQQKQQAVISREGDGKQLQEAKTTTENNKEERTTTTSSSTYPAIEDKINPSTDLDPFIPDMDYVEHVIRTTKRTVKCEDSLPRQIVYSALSKDSCNPINLAILAPTSEGKTYAVQQALNYFPRQDVWMIGSMSPKVLIRQNGISVDKNNKPIQDEVMRLRREIAASNNPADKETLKAQLQQLYQNSRMLIDLSGKLLVFLEPPHPHTWDILKPILSHDSWEIEHPYVYDGERGSGLGVKNVVTVGWPACIFCSAKNESSWPQWPEIQSRFLVTSPNMISERYVEGNVLIAQQTGLPRLLQQRLIVSEKDIDLARKCILYVSQQIRQKSQKRTTTPVYMPFATTLAKALPAEKGTDNRYTKRLFSLLTIIALSKAHLRNRLEIGDESLSIANLENDLLEALKIVHNLSGIPPFKLKFFTEVILPLFNAKTKKDVGPDGEKQEKIVALTSREICDGYKKKIGKIISTNNLKQTYLNEYLSNGLLEEEPSVINAKQNIYFPLVGAIHGIDEIKEEEERKLQNITDEDKSKSLPIITPMDKDLDRVDLLLSKNFINVPENWLELEISALLSHPLEHNNLAYNNSLMIIKKLLGSMDKD